jgi:hypothetical protein
MLDFARRFFRTLLNPWVALGALGVAGVLLVGAGLILFIGPPRPAPGPPTAALTLIPGPTATMVPPTLTPTVPPTPTSGLPPSPLPGTMGIGAYVQVFGTYGEGLNIRSDPSIGASVNFLGFDAEVFEIADGPVEADGYTWWYLVTPVDASRNGWAASNFLTVVSNPNP